MVTSGLEVVTVGAGRAGLLVTRVLTPALPPLVPPLVPGLGSGAGTGRFGTVISLVSSSLSSSIAAGLAGLVGVCGLSEEFGIISIVPFDSSEVVK